MAMLVKDVMDLEQEAAAILSAAQAEARMLEGAAKEEIRAFRQKMTEETDRRIREFRTTMEERHKVSLAEAERELQAALDALENIPEDLLKAQVDLVLARLNEL